MENTKDSRVRIQLIGNVKGYLNIEKDTVFPLTFSISDIRDISKKKGTFSKSIILAGDKNNNRLLNNYFDVNIVAGTFNINTLQYCNVIQNGIPILENALIQLVSINKEQNNSYHEDKVTYTVLIKDTTSDFFSNISNKYLTDLSFSYLNHTYTTDNVINSFGHTAGDGYRYVMPYNPSFEDDNQFQLTEFSPGIFAKTYFDKIFDNAGFIYKWVGLTSSTIQFDKLIIPYTGDIIKVDKYADPQYIVEAHKNITNTYPCDVIQRCAGGGKYCQTYLISEPTQNILNANLIDSDPLGLYSAGIYSIPNIPSYTNDVKFEVEFQYELVVQNGATGPVKFKGSFWNGGSNTGFTNKPLVLNPTFYLNRNGKIVNSYPIIQDGTGVISLPAIGSTYSVGTTILKSGTFKQTGVLNEISANDLLSLSTRNILEPGPLSIYQFTKGVALNVVTDEATIDLKIKSATLKISTQVSGEYGFNTPLDMNLFVPQKIKQSDFIKSIFTMYNIYCEVDKDDLNTLNLISRDAYYDNGKVVNWTKKLAKDLNQELKFLPELQNKKLLLTYKADKDFANESYTKATNEIYGQLEFTFDNQYVKGVTKQELIFSPTPMTNTSFDAVCPMWAGGAPNVNLRILYAGAVYDCSDYVIKNYPGATGTTASSYPYNSHWDKPKTPTFDINFGVCSYYPLTYEYTKTNNNLFNLHWRRTLQQINNGKMLTAYFNLNEVDISKLRLSDKIRIDNSWWNINSITDYDANSKTPTKVELISIDEGLYIPYETKDVVSIDDASPLVSIPRNRIAKDIKNYKNINLSTTDISINGINNVIGSQVKSGSINGSGNTIVSNATVMGDNNYVTSEAVVIGSDNSVESDAYVQGSGNTVSTDASGVSVIGSGIEATQSNTLYTPNIFIPEGGTINNVPVENIISQLELIPGLTGATGWALYGRDPLNYGPIGNGAVDLSIATAPSVGHTFGAVGDYSFASGYFSSALGYGAVAIGIENVSSGYGAVALGVGNTASGDSAVALGIENVSSGSYSFASGNYNTVSGYAAVSIGIENVSSGNGSFTLGFGNTASGSYSFASGFSNGSIGDYSFTRGRYNIATGIDSVALGFQNVSSAYGSFALGIGNTASGAYSVVLGFNAVASGIGSFALGEGIEAATCRETVIGFHAEGITGSATTLDSEDPVFRIGNGGVFTPSDAFRVYKSGAAYLKPITPSSIASPLNGMIAFDSSTNNLCVYDVNTSSWVNYIRESVLLTGTFIDFKIGSAIYNSFTSPDTGNVTHSLVDARTGFVQKMYHQQATVPSFPSEWVLLNGSYSTSLVNTIYAEYSSPTRVEYWIIN